MKRLTMGGGAALVMMMLVTGCVMAPRWNDGYASIGSPGGRDVDRKLAISIGPAVLRFVARFADDDPEAKEILSALEGVRIHLYEVTGSQERVFGKMDRIRERLVDHDWLPVAVVREEDEYVHMLMKVHGDTIRGLTVLAMDGREIAMVNIMGNLKPEHFSEAMEAMEIDVPAITLAAG